MSHPVREEKAAELVSLLEGMIEAYISRYVHMSTNDTPIQELREKLIQALASSAIR